MKMSSKQVTQIPKLLQSLIALVTFRLGTHLREQTDLLRIEARHQSRHCLYWIRVYGDEQIQKELVNQEYGRVLSITFSTAGGVGEEKDEEIKDGLNYIQYFLGELYQGRNDNYDYDDDVDWYTSFQPLPLLARRTEEQIEEVGAIEEIETQINNNGLNWNIKGDANNA
ncbi:MAG: hypothetical protein EZS28_039863, partial [Streblomastix strix]